ncbi:MAG: M15 family metallopeptidase [Erysipelotrichaceae bacterium]|nr:M15 family metallopeptidase [Erysipelotrichaceae bacterium]
MKKKKASLRIITLYLIIVLLLGAIGFMSYKTFFEDSRLHRLGYTYRQIRQLKEYEIAEKIEDFNQSLLYALNSREFVRDNLPYYLLFDSQMDLTRIVNELAKNYSVKDVELMRSFMSDEQIESVIDHEKINDIAALKGIIEKGYDLAEAIRLANALPAESVSHFLSLYQLSQPENYLRYLENGFDDETVCLIFNKLGDEGFNNLSFMHYFSELYGMISSELFDVEMLPRYLMYYHAGNSSTVTKSVSAVNAKKDVVEITDYSTLDVRNPEKVEESSVTMLVNRSHQLSQSYLPESLKDVDADYRYGPCQLTEEALSAFKAMADECLAQTGKQILIYSGYRSYAAIQKDYQQALIDSASNYQMIDSFMFKAGFDESQTGLAVEILEKGQEKDDFSSSAALKWLKENAYNFGYVLRYPQDREFLTRISFSDTHFRYVGIEAATIMKEYGWSLEEYHYLLTGK